MRVHASCAHGGASKSNLPATNDGVNCSKRPIRHPCSQGQSVRHRRVHHKCPALSSALNSSNIPPPSQESRHVDRRSALKHGKEVQAQMWRAGTRHRRRWAHVDEVLALAALRFAA